MEHDEQFQVEFKSRFIMVNYDAVMGGQLTSHEIAVYVVMCAFANNIDKSCFPSYQTLADRAGCSRRTAIRAVSRLSELGFIEKQAQCSKAGDSKSNLYLIMTSLPVRKAPATGNAKNNQNMDKSVDNMLINDGKTSENQKVVPGSHHPSGYGALPLVSGSHHPGDSQSHELYISNYKDNFNYPLSIPPATTRYDRNAWERLKEEIEYGYFEREMPDRMNTVDLLMWVILMLRQEAAPESKRLLADINSSVVNAFLEDLKEKDITEVRNYSAWLKKVFIEFLRKYDAHMKDFW